MPESTSMNRPLSSSALASAVTALLVAALLPFDGIISQTAQALPGGVVAFNKRITDFGTFRLDDLRFRLDRHRRLYPAPGVAQ
jgi:hypothetical protein